ncbi:MAG: hypothetical protein KDA42_13290 [Planctomycetales bacterium]|nr:hypothetical protein [Planctomycetales bacterium]
MRLRRHRTSRVLLVALTASLVAVSIAHRTHGQSATADSAADAAPAKSSSKPTIEKQDAPKGQKNEKAKKPQVTGRLPAYYGTIVTDEQRIEIYKIQASYVDRVEALKKVLRELVAERDAEVRAVLTAEQQKELDAVIAKAREARKKAAAKLPAAVAASKTAE